MRRNTLRACVLVIGVTVAGGRHVVARTAPDPYKLFAQAIRNTSTAPNYVLITVVDRRQGTTRRLCTEAPFLLGALHKQYKLPFSDAGIRKAQQMALANRARVFHFTSAEALANIAPRYTEAVLSDVRTRIGRLTDEQIAAPKWDPDRWVRQYERTTTNAYDGARDALAHVLLERGFLPGRGCIAGYIYLDRRASRSGPLTRRVGRSEMDGPSSAVRLRGGSQRG